MRRYIDFQNESWQDRTDARMQAARLDACQGSVDQEPPFPGVIDTAPISFLTELVEHGFVPPQSAPSDVLLRKALRRAVLATLVEDADCLSPQEHTLAEQMLIGGGVAELTTLSQFEAAYTLQMRLWCDMGTLQGKPAARLDTRVADRLPAALMRAEHQERRARVFVFDGMMHGLLYLTGFIDDRLPMRRFAEEILLTDETERTARLARNYLLASFDCENIAGCNLLLHSALAAPEGLVHRLAAQGMQGVPPVTPNQLVGSMNGLLPEEGIVNQKMRLALTGALRPEVDAGQAAYDLRMLIKQGAPIPALRDVMAGMLCVLPTEHMENTLIEMSQVTPRWVSPLPLPTPMAVDRVPIGLLH